MILRIIKLIAITVTLYVYQFISSYLGGFIFRNEILPVENFTLFFLIVSNISYLFLLIILVIWIKNRKNKQLIFFQGVRDNGFQIFGKVFLLMYLVFLIKVFIYSETQININESTLTEYIYTNGFNAFLLTILKSLFLYPIVEEFIFRKIMLNIYLKNKEDILFGIVITSILYSLLHVYSIPPNWSFLTNIFSGLIFAVLFLRYGLLWTIVAHVLINLFIFLTFYRIIDLRILNFINSSVFSYLFHAILLMIVIVFITSAYKNIKSCRR